MSTVGIARTSAARSKRAIVAPATPRASVPPSAMYARAATETRGAVSALDAATPSSRRA
jgi:hypothetical protein